MERKNGIRVAKKEVDEIIRIGDMVDFNAVEQITGFNPADLSSDEILIQSKHVSDVIGGIGLYETFSRDNEMQPFTYKGQCRCGDDVNKHPECAIKVFVCSAYAADDLTGLVRNVNVAKEACKAVFEQGKIPVAPHLYFPQFIEDDGFTREWGIIAGHEFMKECSEMVVVTQNGNISEGMKQDIEFAVSQLGIEPYFIDITTEEV